MAHIQCMIDGSYDRDNDVIWVVDLDAPGYRSVTNDADNVVPYMLEAYGNHPIIYKDSTGQWDMLEHDGVRFTGFRSLGGTSDYLRAVDRLKSLG